MKKLYWRPSRVPRIALLFTSLLAVVFVLIIESNQVYRQLPHYQEKIQAASLMKDAMEVIKEFRTTKFGPVNQNLDPTSSGLIGLTDSITTSSSGHLGAKQTSINPNWAAVIVAMLKEIDVMPGDYIAIGASGSFPALNIATLAAARILNLNPILISSTAASNWGANIPGFTWLDMERVLDDEGIFNERSVSASLGGKGDAAIGISAQGISTLKDSIARNQIKFIEAETLEESINQRMAVYKKHSRGKRIVAYINVGGGAASVGSSQIKHAFHPGLNVRNWAKGTRDSGVMKRFAELGTPVIHLSYIEKIAEKYGLPKSPKMMPNIGEGVLYGNTEYNRVLAICLCLALLALIYTLLRLDIGYRIFGSFRPLTAAKPPEPMI